MKIYVDVTETIRVDFVTGIQRVVKSVVRELLRIIPNELVLISLNSINGDFYIIDNNLAYNRFVGNSSTCCGGNKQDSKSIKLSDMNAGDIFFEIDSGFTSDYRRSALLPVLKKNGVHIVAFIHDVLPIRYPQFFNEATVYQFIDYIGAYLQYADMIITSTKSVLEDVYRLRDEVDVDNKFKAGYSWLGSNFVGNTSVEAVDEKVATSLTGKKYILYVGTIEPRKNIGFLLDAFEHQLFGDGICLVLAGMIGWNVQELVRRIETHPLTGKQFFYFCGLNDSSIAYLYQNAIAVAFPTYSEGFGLPIVEAIERKVPVITTDNPVLREVGREFADYISLNDEDAFCKIVFKYVLNPDFRKERVSYLDNYVKYSWKDTAEKILALLQEVCGS